MRTPRLLACIAAALLAAFASPTLAQSCGAPKSGDCCSAGTTPFCDDATCCEAICAADPFCCATAWDSLCAAAAQAECGVCQTAPLFCGAAGTGSCCEPGGVRRFEVDGLLSFGLAGDPLNALLDLGFDGPVRIVGISWAVQIQTFGESWLSEAGVRFGTSDEWNLALLPGAGVDDNNDNQPFPFTSGGIFDLRELGLDFSLLADGVLRIEFFETFDDNPGTPDAIWVSGEISLLYDANGLPFCSDAACCEQVCAIDPFCCESAWDPICVSAASLLCTTCADGPACGNVDAGSCCDANDTPFCSDAGCCVAVCEQDPFCCVIAWDTLCTQVAAERCTACGGGDPCPADLDGDGGVGGADLAAMLGQWGFCPGCSGDLDGSGAVDGADLAALLAAWGACPE